MDAYAREILETASRTEGCNLVILSRVSDKPMGVVSGEMVSVDSNVGREGSLGVMAEAARIGRFLYTEAVEVVVTDSGTMERAPGGEYRCFSRCNEVVLVDSDRAVSLVYCTHSGVRPALVPSVDSCRESYVAQRAVFRFGGARLFAEFQEEAPGRRGVHCAYAEVRPDRASPRDVRNILRVLASDPDA